MQADVWIGGGKIAAITAPGTASLGSAEQVIDAQGRFVLPGGVDVHTHLDLAAAGTVTADDFESGTIAAAFGGTTTIVDFANQKKGTSLAAALADWRAKAEGRAVIDYGCHMSVTDATPDVLDEMAEMVAQGVTSFKVFFAYPGTMQLEDDAILRVLLRARALGALVCVHAETGGAIEVLRERAMASGDLLPRAHATTRPEVAEASATERAIALAEMAQAPVYIVHLTSARALAHVRQAQRRGQPVFAETCPHYLFLSAQALEGTPDQPFAGAALVCSPPLRQSAWTRTELWRGLARGELQVVASDHCSFNLKGQKELGLGDFRKIPNGLPAIETRMLLLHQAVIEGRLSVNRFVDVTATTPAKLMGLYPQKGSLAIGADADLAIWDPLQKRVLDHDQLHMRVDYSPYAGMQVQGAPVEVFSRGERIIADGKFVGAPGRGRFLRRAVQPAG
jgi:dihydropyrimidinase